MTTLDNSAYATIVSALSDLSTAAELEDTDANIIKQGWLQKRGEHIKTWRPRYFILFDNGTFRGFKSKPKENSFINFINNFNVRECQVGKMDKPKANAFTVQGLWHMGNTVDRIFCTESTDDRDDWILAINNVASKVKPQTETDNVQDVDKSRYDIGAEKELLSSQLSEISSIDLSSSEFERKAFQILSSVEYTKSQIASRFICPVSLEEAEYLNGVLESDRVFIESTYAIVEDLSHKCDGIANVKTVRSLGFVQKILDIWQKLLHDTDVIQELITASINWYKRAGQVLANLEKIERQYSRLVSNWTQNQGSCEERNNLDVIHQVISKHLQQWDVIVKACESVCHHGEIFLHCIDKIVNKLRLPLKNAQRHDDVLDVLDKMLKKRAAVLESWERRKRQLDSCLQDNKILVKEFDDLIEGLYKGGVQEVISQLNCLSCAVRLGILKRLSSDRTYTFLTKVAELSSNLDEEIHPVYQILNEIELEQRMIVLQVGGKSRWTLLHTACASGDLGTVKSVVKSLTNNQQLVEILSIQNEIFGDTPVHVAAEMAGEDVIWCLFEHLTTDLVLTILQRQNQQGWTPLHKSTRNRNQSVLLMLVRLIVSYHKDNSTVVEEVLMMQAGNGWTFLHATTPCFPVPVMSDILDTLPLRAVVQLLNIKDVQSGRTPLHRGVDNCNHPEVLTQLVKVILKSGDFTDVDKLLTAQDGLEWTFLHIAAYQASNRVLEDLLKLLPLDIVTRLLKMKNSEGNTPLQNSIRNLQHPGTVKSLLSFILEQVDSSEMETILLAKNESGRTFFHMAAVEGTGEMMGDIVKTVSRELAQDLLALKDVRGQRPADLHQSKNVVDLSDCDLRRDHLLQAGSYPVEFYYLPMPPKVLVFYSTKKRPSAENPANEKTDAETEMSHVKKYFEDRNIPFEVVKDPTAEDIFSNITAAVIRGDVSGLVVFVMSHGDKGVIQVEGNPCFLAVDELMRHMCGGTEGKPKALIIQACQTSSLPAVGTPTAEPDAETNTDDNDGVAVASSAGATSGATFDWSITPPVTVGSPVVRRRIDPLAGGGTKQQAMREGASLKQPDFLLYMATVSGTYALRNVMIPNFISSLREISPCDCITDACQSANLKIQEELQRIDPHSVSGQLPKLEMTLTKKFCIAKDFDWAANVTQTG